MAFLSDRFRSRPVQAITAGLSFLLFLLGIGTIATAAWIVYAGYSATPSMDHWIPLADLARGRSWHSLSWLWMQHNEHRIPLLRLAIAADVYAFGGRSLLLFTLTFVTVILHSLIWAFFLKKTAKLSGIVWMSTTAVFVYSIFCPYQFENFIWAFEWTNVACFFFASASLLGFLSYCFANRPWTAVIVAAAGAFLSESSLAAGVVTWPVLWLASAAVPLRRKHRLTLIALGSIAIVAFLWGYHTSGYNPLTHLRQPGRLARYLLTYFDHWFTNFVTYPAVPALVAFLLGSAATAFLFLRDSSRRMGLTLATLQLFLLGTALLTALGRVNAPGAFQAEASRYQAPVMLFWACIFAALIVAAWELASWRDVITLNLIGIVIVACQLPYVRNMATWLPTRTDQISSLGEALDQGAKEPTLQQAIVVSLDTVVPAVEFLHKLGNSIAPSTLKSFPRNVSALPQNANLCQGAFESVTLLPRLYPGPKEARADGWSLVSFRVPPAAVMITDKDGNVLAGNRLHFPRPDVLSAAPYAEGLPGWRIYVPVPDQVDQLRAFALVGNQVCPVGAPRDVK